jgi:hypothetical protein
MGFQSISGMVVVCLSFAASVGAHGSSCKVPLRNVLVSDQDCGYYETAFRMMATDKVSVNSVCSKGAFPGPNGVVYKTQVLTNLTVHDTTCDKMKAVELNPVLLSKTNCDNLKNVVSMLSTDFVGVDPACNFGKWQGADGSARTSMVATRMSLKQKTAQK